MRALMVLSVIFCIPALAAQDLEENRRQIYIVEPNQKEAVKVSNPAALAPNRVHLLFSKALQTWSYTKTDGKGRVTDPMEVIAIESVVPGTWIGAKGGTRYQLSPKGMWVKTNGPEQLRLVVTGKKPVVRIIERKPANAYQPMKAALK